jgi:hypothetical protein
MAELFRGQPSEVWDVLEPLAEQAERDYRRAQSQDPGNKKKRIEILKQFAPTVFKTQVAKRLKSRACSADDFKRAIGLRGGVGALALHYAYRLYYAVAKSLEFKRSERAFKLEMEALIREAEDLWYNPDLVPEGWAKFLDNSASSTDGSPDSPSTDHEIAPSPEADRKAPSELFKKFKTKYRIASYEQLAARMLISRSTLFKIKNETAWVRDDKYEAAAGVLKCAAADLHPRGLKRDPAPPKDSSQVGP